MFSTSKTVDKKSIHTLIGSLKNELNLQIDFLVINFVSSEEITELNEKYLNHYHSTDIITFDYAENKANIDGEIIISASVEIVSERQVCVTAYGAKNFGGHPADKPLIHSSETQEMNAPLIKQM